MLEVMKQVGEVESNATQEAADFVVLANLQLALIGGGSGIAQLD
jgi:hypothetical protein